MAGSILTTTLTLFALLAVGSCLQIRADLNLFTGCTASNEVQGGCEFNWNNASIWIGQLVPGLQDDVIINTDDKVLTFTCDGLCTARQLNTTAHKITIRLSHNASMVLDTWTATNNIYIEGGVSFNATGVTVVSANSFHANQTTMQIDSLTANDVYFTVSKVTVTKELSVGVIREALGSFLYFLGTCKSNASPGTQQTFLRNYLYLTTACQHPFSGAVAFNFSNWDIDIGATSVYLLPDWITMSFEQAVVQLKSPLELHINATVRLSNTLFGNPYDRAFVVLHDNGCLSASRSFFPLTAITALGGVLEFDEDFSMWGTLRLGSRSTLQFNRKHNTEGQRYLSTNYLVLEQPTLNYFNARPGTFVIFNKGNLTGSFGTVNMNNLPYAIEYNNTQGYIAAVPVATPVAAPQVLTPVSAPQSQVPVTNAPVFDAPQEAPHAQPVSESSPSSSNMSPAVSTDNSESTSNIVLGVILAAAVVVLIVLGALLYRAKKASYQVIKDASMSARLEQRN